jgi:ATP-dependent DNA ligase
MTAGKRIRTVASQRPAQYVDFDVLAAGREDLRRPPRQRRLIGERALSGLGSPIVLGQQTENLVTAREWLQTLTAGGIEGGGDQGRRWHLSHSGRSTVWWKCKSKATLDMGTDRMALLLWTPCLRRLGR